MLDCPGGTFQGAGVKTVVLFFEKGAPTRNIWFYQLDPGRSLGKTNPLNDGDLREFVELQAGFEESGNSWSVDAGDIDQATFDLSVKNPNAPEAAPSREPEEILAEIATLDAEGVRKDHEREFENHAVMSGWKPSNPWMSYATIAVAVVHRRPKLRRYLDSER